MLGMQVANDSSQTVGKLYPENEVIHKEYPSYLFSYGYDN